VFKKSQKPSSSNATPSNTAQQNRSRGDELQQMAGGEWPSWTTNQGLPVSDNQNSLKATPRGPALLEDFILREKITHFDHGRIPERFVHARGTAAHSHFELNKSLDRYTSAKNLHRKRRQDTVVYLHL
jgi:catalase